MATLTKDSNTRTGRGAGNELHLACRDGDLEKARDLLKCGMSVNARSTGFCGGTPLHVAETVEIIRELLDHKAELEIKNELEQTPLFWKCHFGRRLDVIEELLDGGANIEAVGVHGETPIFKAINVNKVEVVDLLLSRGASLNAVDEYGNTVLHYACKDIDGEKIEVFYKLVDHGGDINARNKGGQTPLALAVNNWYLEMVGPLLARGASVNIPDNKGYAPLHHATHVKTICALLEAGADIDSRANDGDTALDHACYFLNKDAAELLLSRGAAFPDLEHLIAKARQSSIKSQTVVEFIQFLEEYAMSMHPVMK